MHSATAEVIGSGPRLPVVLIVEDEFLQRVALADYLHGGGLDVVEATTVDAAFDVLNRGNVLIDIVVTDITTPGTSDGFMLARWIKNNRPALPVIIVSGYATEAQRAELRLSGETYFPKPYDERALLAKIRLLLRDAGY